MGLCNSPFIFLEKMIKVFNGLDYVGTYINDLLIISNKSLENHIEKLDKVISKLKPDGLKMNAEKFFCARNGLEYLGFKISRESIMSLPDKVEAIKNIAVPITNK